MSLLSRFKKPKEDTFDVDKILENLVPVGTDPFKGFKAPYEAKKERREPTLEERVRSLESQIKYLEKYKWMFLDLLGGADKISDEIWEKHFGKSFNYNYEKDGPIIGYVDEPS